MIRSSSGKNVPERLCGSGGIDKIVAFLVIVGAGASTMKVVCRSFRHYNKAAEFARRTRRYPKP